MSNNEIFTDSYGDTLALQNFTEPSKDGVFRLTQNDKTSVFGLKGAQRMPLVKHLLKPLNATVIEGVLPATELKISYGVKKVHAGGATGEISAAEVDYFRTQGLKYLAIAQRIELELDLEKETREAKKAADAKLAERRDILARQFSNGFYTYGEVTSATAKAINEVIRLENAK